MRLRPILLSAAAAGFLAAPAAAEPYALDRDHAQVLFSADHLGFSIVHGVFHEFEAEIDFDPADIESASVTFTIDAASLDTQSEQRDKHLRSANFLDVENHPEITFVSTRIDLTSAETAEVTGDVTIRGVTREEVFVVRLNRIGPSPFDPQQTIAGFTVTGEIDRRNYGVSFGAPAIGATIPIRLDLEASPKR